MKFRVPATTGNTGPGFDSVGLAFTLYARFEAELLPAGQLAISGCEAKYQKLGIPFPVAHLPECSPETIRELKQYL